MDLNQVVIRKKTTALLNRARSHKTSLPYGFTQWDCSASRRSSEWLSRSSLGSYVLNNQTMTTEHNIYYSKKKKKQSRSDGWTYFGLKNIFKPNY